MLEQQLHCDQQEKITVKSNDHACKNITRPAATAGCTPEAEPAPKECCVDELKDSYRAENYGSQAVFARCRTYTNQCCCRVFTLVHFAGRRAPP